MQFVYNLLNYEILKPINSTQKKYRHSLADILISSDLNSGKFDKIQDIDKYIQLYFFNTQCNSLLKS
jgi:hypothetical protein